MNKNSGNIVKWILIALILVWTLLPIYWGLKNSVQTVAEISAFPPRFLPRNPTLRAFYAVAGVDFISKGGEVVLPSGMAEQVMGGLWNSFLLATIVMCITIVVVVPLAYVFGRLEFPHKNKLFFAVLLAVVIPPVSTLLPFYLLFMKLKLTGTLIGLIIVTLTITIPFVTWMMVGFFRNLPSVERLACIDGFSRMETLIRIVIPMARIGILTGAIIAFLFAWNEFTFANVLVNSTSATTVPPAVTGFLLLDPQPANLAASLVYALVPSFAVVYLLQRYIVKMNIVEPLG
jgi:multiple sugar transport system permease protein